MKTILTSLFVLMCTFSNAQLLDGDIVTEGRKMVGTSNFKVVDPCEGAMYFELSVNRKGEVTSAKYLKEETNYFSTPAKIKVRNYLMKLKFQEGTHYPEFHHVRVKVTFIKE